MLFILHRAVKKLLNLRVEGCQPVLSFGEGEVNAHICSRGDDVELGIKDIYTMNNTVETRKCECSVAFILSNSILASSNFLECTGDDKVRMVHRYKISCKLA